MPFDFATPVDTANADFFGQCGLRKREQPALDALPNAVEHLRPILIGCRQNDDLSKPIGLSEHRVHPIKKSFELTRNIAEINRQRQRHHIRPNHFAHNLFCIVVYNTAPRVFTRFASCAVLDGLISKINLLDIVAGRFCTL